MFKFVSTKVGFGETRTLKQRSWKSYNFAIYWVKTIFGRNWQREKKERKKAIGLIRNLSVRMGFSD